MSLRILQSVCPIPRHALHGAGPSLVPDDLDRLQDTDDPDGRRGLDRLSDLYRLSDLGSLDCVRGVQALSRSITKYPIPAKATRRCLRLRWY